MRWGKEREREGLRCGLRCVCGAVFCGAARCVYPCAREMKIAFTVLVWSGQGAGRDLELHHHHLQYSPVQSNTVQYSTVQCSAVTWGTMRLLVLWLGLAASVGAGSSVDPYQYFLGDGTGGWAACCWLTPYAFPTLDGLQCELATTISQIPGRQIFSCHGPRDAFCNACAHVADQMQPKHKSGERWRVQGC